MCVVAEVDAVVAEVDTLVVVVVAKTFRKGRFPHVHVPRVSCANPLPFPSTRDTFWPH